MPIKKRSSQFSRLVAVALILISLFAGIAIFQWQTLVNSPLDIEDHGFYYVLHEGTSARKLANDLHMAGILPHPRLFLLLLRIENAHTKLRAGEYYIRKGTTAYQLIEQMLQGRVILHALTLIEGWRYEQVIEAIKKNQRIKHTLTYGKLNLMKKIGHIDNLHPEGQFFPDTYYFILGESDFTVLSNAFEKMQMILRREWKNKDINVKLKTPYEALILASIVEREATLPDERPKIAGVFLRRLEKGIRLQSDPTIIYAMGKDYNGNIRKKDLKTKSLYNTYLYKGLPPTPIALPGLASIHAVMHPASGKDLYFVAKGDGSHVFSSTLKQHNQAVRKYQLNQKVKQ